MKVFEVRPWNHQFNQNRDKSIDVYVVAEWEIHSIGKKILKVQDGKGMKGNHFRANMKGNFLSKEGFNYFVFDKKDVENCVLQIRRFDTMKNSSYEIIERRF